MDVTIDQIINIKYIAAACIYSALGIVILGISFVIFDKMTPGNLWKEIVIEHNLPLAITVGAMTLAISQIIASAIHG